MTAHLDPNLELHLLPGLERAAALSHARGCAECRQRLLENDPTALFAFLDEIEVPEALLAAVSAGVAAAVDREPASRGWLMPAAAWAAAAALAIGLLVPAAHESETPLPIAAATVSDAPRAGIESLQTPGAAQVLDLTVGDTQVVMIFDEELSL